MSIFTTPVVERAWGGGDCRLSGYARHPPPVGNIIRSIYILYRFGTRLLSFDVKSNSDKDNIYISLFFFSLPSPHYL